MTTLKNSKRRFALAAVAAVMALTATARSAMPANADEWRRHHGWSDDDHGWYGGPSFSFYGGPSYYYAPAPTYYYPPPPVYYQPAPVYYGPPSIGFSINVPLRGRY